MNRDSYKEYVENAIAYNRKMNEERKMRIPYIDGQASFFVGASLYDVNDIHAVY